MWGKGTFLSQLPRESTGQALFSSLLSKEAATDDWEFASLAVEIVFQVNTEIPHDL